MKLVRPAQLALLASVPLFAACGGAGLQLGDVTPQSVPSLESERAQKPQDPTVLTRLGVAYFRANRYPEARQALDSVVARDPQNGIAAIYRGMTAEEQGDFPAARSSYEAFIAVARSRDLKNLARQRLSLVGRRELEYQARQALAQESELGGQTPDANTIAVMPFTYNGTNQDLQPLSRGFAQLVVTDLAKSRQLRVLERERMQAMLDELRLSSQGRTDSTTAARTGRLLRAASVVQGSIGEPQSDVLRIDATVVNTTTAGVAPSVNAADQLSRLFDVEKSLVLQIFDRVGIVLTPAERLALDQRPTQNLQAFLAWSRGLQAEDNGDFAGAQSLYDQASRIDPSFTAAQQSSAKAADLTVAAATSVSNVEASVSTSAATETGTSGTASTANALSNGSGGVTPQTNAPTSGGGSSSSDQSSTGSNQPKQDRPPTDPITTPTPTASPTGVIKIIIARP